MTFCFSSGQSKRLDRLWPTFMLWLIFFFFLLAQLRKLDSSLVPPLQSERTNPNLNQTRFSAQFIVFMLNVAEGHIICACKNEPFSKLCTRSRCEHLDIVWLVFVIWCQMVPVYSKTKGVASLFWLRGVKHADHKVLLNA